MTRPIQFATNTLFPAGPNLWNGQPNKVTPPAGVLADGFTPATLAPAEYVNAILSNYGTVLAELRRDARAAAAQFSIAPVLSPAGSLPLSANALAHVAGLDCADGREVIAYSWRTPAALPSIYFLEGYNRTGALNGIPARNLVGVAVTSWPIGAIPANSEPRVFMYDAPAAGTPPNGRAIAYAYGSVGATFAPHFATAIGAAFAVSAGAPSAFYDGAAYAAATGTLIALRRNATGAHEIYTSTNNGANWTLRHTFPVLAGSAAFESGNAVAVDPTTQRAFVVDSLRRVRYADAPFTVWNAADLPATAPVQLAFDVATFGGRVWILERNNIAPQGVTDESRERVWYASTTGAPAWSLLVSQINALQFVQPAPGVFGILANRLLHLTEDGLSWDSFAHFYQPGNARGFAHASGPSGVSACAGGYIFGSLRNPAAIAGIPVIQSGQFRPSSVLV
jgi:hypothetical protein